MITFRRRFEGLSLAGVIIGVWAILPPYLGPGLAGVPIKREVADHVIPGVLIVSLAVAQFVVVRRSDHRAVSGLLAGMAVSLCGIWMTAAHLPLVAQALHRQAPVPSVVHHTLPGLVVGVLGIVWSGTFWREAVDRV